MKIYLPYFGGLYKMKAMENPVDKMVELLKELALVALLVLPYWLGGLLLQVK